MPILAKRFLVLISVFALSMAIYFLLYLIQYDAKVWSEIWVPKVAEVKGSIVGENEDENRIILLAGSNGLFGYDSEELSRMTGKRALNLSTHAGLPLEYHIWLLDRFGRSGDLVVIPLEISYYYEEFRFDDWSTHNLLVWGKDFLDTLSWSKKFDFIVSTNPERVGLGLFTTLFQKRVPPSYHFRDDQVGDIINETKAVWKSGQYGAKYTHLSVNPYGDMQSNSGRTFFEPIDYEFEARVSNLFLKNLENLKQLASSREMSLLFTWPVLVKSSADRDEEPGYVDMLREIQSALERHGLSIAGDPGAVILDETLLHDTIYHLNEEGREVRTRQLASLISRELSDTEAIISP